MINHISIDKLKEGDRGAFDVFYKHSFALFLSFASRFISDRETCRDVVQNAFMRYWERHSEFSDAISTKVFFYRTIRNECLNHLSRGRISERYALHRSSAAGDEELFLDNIIREEISFAIHRTIEGLSPMARQVLMLAIDGKKNDEIAQSLEVSVNTVKTHKARAYKLLRIQLIELRIIIL